MTDRASYISGLRKLADLLEQHADVILPTDGSLLPLSFSAWGEDARDQAAIFARAFPGKLDKEVDENYFRLTGRIDGLKVQFVANRHQVCERKVIGTRTVTSEIPDPDYDVPTVVVEHEVEDVEWVCPPLLAGEVSA